MKLVDVVAKLVDGHDEIPLPFRRVDVQLSNKLQSEKSLASLKKKLTRSDKFKYDYIKFMKELTSKRYAKKSSTVTESGRCWYLPHCGVYHPNKLGKTCAVFDLIAEHHGASVNKELLPGPDLTNQIVGVLLCFREKPIAVIGDIEAICYQVKVSEQQKAT